MLRMLKGQPSSGGSVDLAHRLHGVEVRLDRIHVAARHVREPRIRERRIQPLALLIDAFVHRAVEIVLAPRADAGIRIGRDVGRIDDPERRRYRTPARIGFAARRGVARLAIAGAREVAAGFDGCPGVVGTHGRIHLHRRHRDASACQRQYACDEPARVHVCTSGCGFFM